MSEHRHDPEAFAKWLEQQEKAKRPTWWEEGKAALREEMRQLWPTLKQIGSTKIVSRPKGFRGFCKTAMLGFAGLFLGSGLEPSNELPRAIDPDAASNDFSGWDGSHGPSVRSIKAALKDPSSFSC